METWPQTYIECQVNVPSLERKNELQHRTHRQVDVKLVSVMGTDRYENVSASPNLTRHNLTQPNLS